MFSIHDSVKHFIQILKKTDGGILLWKYVFSPDIRSNECVPPQEYVIVTE